MARLLIIEDDARLARGISELLEPDESVLTSGIIRARRYLEEESFDLILLDLNLPDGDGLAFCTRELSSYGIPVVMLTARDLDEDELAGLQAGADDYITKPFDPRILKARISKLLGRREKPVSLELFGKIGYDRASRIFTHEGTVLSLSATEHELLCLLVENAGRILLKEELLMRIWKDELVDENTLTVNISRLRAKVEEDPKKPEHLKTIRGMGYLWQ